MYPFHVTVQKFRTGSQAFDRTDSHLDSIAPSLITFWTEFKRKSTFCWLRRVIRDMLQPPGLTMPP